MAIWSKGGDETNALVQAFTVGDDYRYDCELAPYDILGSLAHARMLAAVGLIPADDGAALDQGLRELHGRFRAKEWTVSVEDEDVHSRIEALLTERLGEAGKRLHTGRSRNDQVLTAIRLWQKDQCLAIASQAAAAASALLAQARHHEFTPLPGYTHLQRAMPSSCGQFFGAHAAALIDDLILLEAAWQLADACPLGSGAGYGTGLPLDREMSARLLGFARWGAIAQHDANSRGKVETALLDALGAMVNDLSRLAADIVFFTTQECGFLRLGAGFTTGSSIMPQKRNPDLFELLRGRSARFLGLRTALYATTLGLPSGYSRDLQDSKALVMDGVALARQALAVTTAAAPALEPVEERILAALDPAIYATDEAYRLMREQGLPFREAYIAVGRALDAIPAYDHHATLRQRSHAGSTGNLGLDALGHSLDERQATWQQRAEHLHSTWHELLGADL